VKSEAERLKMPNSDDPVESFRLFLADEMDALSPRIEALERRRGLSPLTFARPLEGLTSQERLDATTALAKWRLERLEALDHLN
jgi:hypothetical protein